MRNQILNGLASVPVSYDRTVVDELERRVLAAHPANPSNYAFVVGRNWAISRLRTQRYQERVAALAARRAEEDRLQHEMFERCTREFAELTARLVPELRETQLRMIGMVRLSVLERRADEECAERYPGSTPAQRWQWKRRGLKLLLPHASSELAVILSRRCWKHTSA